MTSKQTRRVFTDCRFLDSDIAAIENEMLRISELKGGEPVRCLAIEVVCALQHYRHQLVMRKERRSREQGGAA